MKRRLRSNPKLVLGILLAISVNSLSALQLRFLYHQGDEFRFYGTSQQVVYLNGRRLQNNLDTYRVSYKVAQANDQEGRLVGETLYTSQRDGESAHQIDESFHTDYLCNSLGQYKISPEAVLPVVRGVPTFPDHAVQPGDTWQAPGEEREDFSDIQAFTKAAGRPLPAFPIPLVVNYTYVGPVVKDGKTLQLLTAEYHLYYKATVSPSVYPLYPALVTGEVQAKIWFDEQKGHEDSYQDAYRIVLHLNSGERLEFDGQSQSRLIQAKLMNKPKVVEEVKKSLEEKGLGNVQVRTNDKGVVLNLDNIQFPADSAELLPSEQEKLNKIGAILKKYPDRDILVEGFTALAGTAKDRLKLSQDRAAAVGNYLVTIGVRKPEQITYRGWGAEKPIAPNDNEADMKKNRRVEITILEN